MPLIYLEYIVRFVIFYVAFILMDFGFRLIFQKPLKKVNFHGMLIGAVIMSFAATVNSKLQPSNGIGIIILILGIVVWNILEHILTT